MRYGIDKSSIRFDIVAHSMGGLVARYYLRYGGDRLPSDGPVPIPTWKGAAHVDNLIMIGTPNGGSIDSLVHLIDGYRPFV
jgi:triacylglycerol esterase/lipase EstA (alpha/beta hydrolase family)